MASIERSRPRNRQTADERREQIVAAATAEFAATGLHGTSTEAIARRAGISQPYLFRLFRTKRELFLACVEGCFERTAETFRAASATAPPPADPELPENAVLRAMAVAYVEMLADRELLLMQLQTYAACADDEIRALARERYGELYGEVERLSGAPPDEVRAFFAKGMLLNVAAAMNLAEIAADKQWVRSALEEIQA